MGASMAVQASSIFEASSMSLADDIRGQTNALAKLAALHAEAEESARLSYMLGRSLYVAMALPLAATVAIFLASGAGTAPRVAWGVLVAVASVAIARTYVSTVDQPFERSALRAFEQNLMAVLIYAGCAWGAGAFLVLTSTAPLGAALVFAAGPAAGLGLLLCDRKAILLFLAPVALLTSFACVLRHFTDGAMNAMSVLGACALFAAALVIADRYRTGDHGEDAVLRLLEA
jgi:hypothetical protein